jgi:hypothetical protein
MYIVVSRQNASDVQVPGLAILCLTETPGAALSSCRRNREGQDASFIATIAIYDIESNKAYELSDFKDSENMPLVYITEKQYGKDAWNEKFFGTFKIFKRRKVGVLDKEEEKASLGMFRALVLIDSDELWHIYEDVPTVSEAYKLCLEASKGRYPFCVFDDQGIPQTKEGKLLAAAAL